MCLAGMNMEKFELELALEIFENSGALNMTKTVSGGYWYAEGIGKRDYTNFGGRNEEETA